MKKLFVLTTVLTFSFAVMAQCPGSVARAAAIKANAEKTCADWKAENKCPRTAAESASCADQRAAGKCPKANAQATAQAAPTGCGGCSKQAAEKSEVKPKTNSKATQRSQRKNRTR